MNGQFTADQHAGRHSPVPARVSSAEIERALARNELAVEYQPLVDLPTGRISALEALVRWHHPRLGRLTPDSFLAVAEQSGAIIEIDDRVVRQACGDLAGLRVSGMAGLRMAVNVSMRSLEDPSFGDRVLATRAAHEIGPGELELEVTESLDLADGNVVVGTLNELRAQGVKVALDDFGTGYSVLDRLRVLPFDALKIDRSFVAGIDARPGGQLVAAAIALGHALGLRVVAEGVETKSQLALLVGHGCDEAQGYLLGRPSSVGRVAEQLRSSGQELPAIPAAGHHLLSRDPAALERLVRPLLGELARLTDLESTYLTVIDRARDKQVILYARNSGELLVGEGLQVPWTDTVCKRSLETGVRCTSDVASVFSDSRAGRDLGLQSYAGVPVYGDGGTVWGTLCGASRSRRKLGEATLTVMDAFARLIADQLRLHEWRMPPAAARAAAGGAPSRGRRTVD